MLLLPPRSYGSHSSILKGDYTVLDAMLPICLNMCLSPKCFMNLMTCAAHYLEHYVKQQLFQSLPLHTDPSLNCPGETAELWQSVLSWPLVRT